jgi:hypothetical protein
MKEELNRELIWSFGGGHQSIGMLALIASGQLPKPAHTIIADTNRESSLTWEYTRRYTIPFMKSLGMTLEVAPHSYAHRDLYSNNNQLLLPAYTQSGRFPLYCSSEWKKLVLRRYMRSIGYGPERPVLLWIGISLDEFTRMKSSDVKWIKNYFPLCLDLQITREECIQEVSRVGLPEPPRSSCWMCPNRRDPEWLDQQQRAPADHEKAITLDRMIRERDELHSLYLHEARIPLDQVTFNPKQPPRPAAGQMCITECWT